MDLELLSQNYFNNLNALAQKIAIDIKQTKEAYQEFWESLSKKEQEQVIDECIVTPAAVLKYSHIKVLGAPKDNSLHSWFTRSQLDLINQSRLDDRNFSEKTVDQLSEDETFIKKRNDDKEVSQEFKNSPASKSSNSSHKTSVLKPKNPPPPPPKKTPVVASDNETTLRQSTSSISSNDIPKTGFDFLDNW